MKSNGKLAPFIAEPLQPVENKRKPCAIAHGHISITPQIRRRILRTALDVIAEADVRGEDLSVTREVSRRLRMPAGIVNRALWDWLVRFRSEAAARRLGIPLEAI